MILALALLATPAPAPQEKLELADRWIYCSVNLATDKTIDDLEALMARAAKAGYTGILLSDTKFVRLSGMDQHYFANVERVKQAASALRIDIVPAVFPIGYSESLLFHDANLAEALPVRDTLFVVANGAARVVADPPVELPAAFADWDWRDDSVVLEKEKTAHLHGAPGASARVMKKVKVRPFAQYHVSVRVKTSRFSGDARINVLAAGKPLVFSSLGVKPDADWTEHHAVFNSLENAEVLVYLGTWGAQKGDLWWRSPKLAEVGLLNVVRRGGAPLTVKNDAGAVLAEGKDFAQVVDPRMGTVPWPGGFEVWHEPPPIKVPLPDGTRLRVSYHHAVTFNDGQVCICPSEPKTVELLADHARRVHAAWSAKAYFMSHDEIRLLNRDESCTARKLDAGEFLADNARTCVKLLRDVAPHATIYVWSDMFDPNHNAHRDYYLVRGDLKGSWEGLDQDVVIAVWYAERRDASMKFFAARGHRMLMAAYYDDKPEDVKLWLESARKVKGVTGVMYTTWQAKYDDLERFAAALR